MQTDPSNTLALLLDLKREYGDLNRALILTYVAVHGPTSERSLAQDVGLSRSVVRRSLQEWLEKNH